MLFFMSYDRDLITKKGKIKEFIVRKENSV